MTLEPAIISVLRKIGGRRSAGPPWEEKKKRSIWGKGRSASYLARTTTAQVFGRGQIECHEESKAIRKDLHVLPSLSQYAYRIICRLRHQRKQGFVLEKELTVL